MRLNEKGLKALVRTHHDATQRPSDCPYCVEFARHHGIPLRALDRVFEIPRMITGKAVCSHCGTTVTGTGVSVNVGCPRDRCPGTMEEVTDGDKR